MKPFLPYLAGFAILLLMGTLRSQQPQFFPLNVSYALFNAEGNEEYVEFYIAFLQQNLRYVPDDSGYVAHFTLQLEVHSREALTYRETQPFVNRIRTLEEIHPYSELRHLFLCKLPAGTYSASIALTDSESGARGEYLMDLEVKPFQDNQLTLSDIQLAEKISKAEQKTSFYKNGLEVIPNPSGVYTLVQPMLYYYAEAYNLPFSEAEPGTYTVDSYITDKQGSVVRTFPQKKKQKAGNSAVLVGGHNIVTLNSDTYFLNLQFTDDQTRQTVTRTHPFRMFKPSKEQLDLAERTRAVTTELMASYYSRLSETEMDQEFDKAKYIATNEEKKIFKNLDARGKVEFLVEFWRKRDTDPTTPQNEFKIKYFEMVEYAQLNFRTKFKEGWKSDRGRVLLIYGFPDDIQRSPSESGKKPYEMWTYNSLDGGSIFIFADLRGFGDYELLHSTYRKELNQPDWQRLIEVQRDNSAFR